MISSLLKGLGIAGVSTGIYGAFTSDKIENKNKDRKNEYICIFTIILIVSLIILFITSGKSESVVLKGSGINSMSSINNKPPF